MTEVAGKVAGKIAEKAGGSSSLVDMLPTDKLTEVAETLLKTMANKAVDAAIDQIENLTGQLTDVAENGGQGLGSVLGGVLGGGGGSVTDTVKSGMSTLTSGVGDKAKGVLGMSTDSDSDSSGGGSGGGGGSGKFKFMNITESMDVGVPLRMAYDQWTQYADFPSFMKKVETVDQESDEKTNWSAKVLWSKRSWESTTIEQVPDSHIIWRSTGAKGYADGHVSFHELAPRLTRILLVLEYYPQGFVEKTGNIWRAVGRRTRLEFKHFCRNLSMVTILTPEEDLQGWRGEIRDSEVIKTHEEALEEAQGDTDGQEPPDEAEDQDGVDYDEAVDEAEEDVDEDEELDENEDEDLDRGDELDDENPEQVEEDEPEDEAEDEAEPASDEDQVQGNDDEAQDTSKKRGRRARPRRERAPA